eukprot:TRINITY_DN47255_c0_g1_i1.p1 TRINITY_DN47255_c0_g1~~TRINITY_DN47255_c0_g1_i1.p1  ORF type:complete len:588 (+),score=183.33 TRINITY_DN47255_c0_g1_i1:140-1765(+)
MPADFWGDGEKRAAFSAWFHECVQTVLDSEAWQTAVEGFHTVLETLGFPKPYPTSEQCLWTIATTAAVLLLYYLLFGKWHRSQRRQLTDRVRQLEQELRQAQRSLVEEERHLRRGSGGKQIRIWMDGAFDMMHYGHMNAFRQGRALGTHLVVGVNSDASIEKCKGTPPVLNDDERLKAVAGCRFVDEVVPEAPYVMNKEYIEQVVFGKYRCDYIVHGDDPCIVDGKDVFQVARDLGRYREIPRTEGVSTTDIVGRMLLVGDTRHHETETDHAISDTESVEGRCVVAAGLDAFRTQQPSRFLTTNTILQLFSAGCRPPPKGARIVYMDGAWDMFHAGHIETLGKARELGDYLLVGVHSDQVVNTMRGSNFPIMNMHERTLSVLGCRHVDDVLLDAPWDITREMIKSLNIGIVAHGTTNDPSDNTSATASPELSNYNVPREMGIYKEIPSISRLTVLEIVRRIHAQRDKFEAKFEKKMKAEREYYADRYGTQGAPAGGGAAEAPLKPGQPIVSPIPPKPQTLGGGGPSVLSGAAKRAGKKSGK